MKSKEILELICSNPECSCFIVSGGNDAEEVKQNLEVIFDKAILLIVKEGVFASSLFVSRGQFLSSRMYNNWDALVVEKNERHVDVYYLYAIND